MKKKFTKNLYQIYPFNYIFFLIKNIFKIAFYLNIYNLKIYVCSIYYSDRNDCNKNNNYD